MSANHVKHNKDAKAYITADRSSDSKINDFAQSIKNIFFKFSKTNSNKKYTLLYENVFLKNSFKSGKTLLLFFKLILTINLIQNYSKRKKNIARIFRCRLYNHPFNKLYNKFVF